MNDSSSHESFIAWTRGTLLLASFLDKGVASPFVHFSSYIYPTSFSSFLYFNLARENSSSLFLIDLSAIVNAVTSEAVSSIKTYLLVSSSSLFLRTFILSEQFLIEDISLGT